MGERSETLYNMFCNGMSGVNGKLDKENDSYYYNILLLMLIFLHVNNDGDILRGAYSYASHAYGFFTFFNKYEAIKDKFEKLYLDSEGLINQAINGYEDEIAMGGELFKTVSDSVDKIRENLRDYIQSGEVFFTNYETDDEKLDGLLYKSDFHKNNRSKFDFEDISFKERRFLTICEYYYLKNAGLSYEQRCLMCYFIVRYLEDYRGFKY